MSGWRRIWNLLAYGTLSAVNDAGAVQTVQVQIGPDEIRDSAPNVQLFGLSANPPTGTEVVVIFPGGDRANGVVVGSNHQASRPTGQASGETTLFNAFGMLVKLTANGIVIDGGGKPVHFTNGDVHVDGAVIAGYGGADQVGLQTHTHPGDSGGTTGQPNAGT